MKDYTYHSNSLNHLKVVLILSLLFILIFLSACPKGIVEVAEQFILRISGTITNEITGSPIENAMVELYKTSFEGYAGRKSIKIIRTDQKGYYYMEYDGAFTPIDTTHPQQSTAELRLWAHKDGYKSARWEVLSNIKELQTRDFQLSPVN